jgi:hypothetical protein
MLFILKEWLSFSKMYTVWTILLILFVVNAQELPNLDVTQEEIADLVNQMRDADTNRAKPGQISLDYQGFTLFFMRVIQSFISGHTGSADIEDQARNP